MTSTDDLDHLSGAANAKSDGERVFEFGLDLEKANEIMQRVNRQVAGSRDMTKVLPLVLQEVCPLIGNRSAAVYRYDSESNALIFVCGYDAGRAVLEFSDHPFGRPGLKLKVSEFPGWQSLLDSPDGRFAVVGRESSAPPMGAWHRARNHRLLLRALLRGDSGPVGMLGLAFEQEQLPDASRMALYDNLAQSVTLIVQMACLAEDAREGAIAREREYAASQRAREAQKMCSLLEGVVAASRSLLDESDLDDGLQRWLAILADAAAADVAFFGFFGQPDSSAAVKTLEWSRHGEPHPEDAPSTKDFSDWAERLGRGETVWCSVDGLADPASVSSWVSQNRKCMLVVPVMAKEAALAWVAFSWSEHRTCNETINAALRTAADSAASAILRQRSIAASIAEREKGQRDRLSVLMQSNDALRSALDALAEAGSEDGFIQSSLAEIERISGSDAAYLFRKTGDDHLLRLVGSTRNGIFSAIGEPGDPPEFRQGIHPHAEMMTRLIETGRLIVRSVEVEPDQHSPSTLVWHRKQGHLANALHALTIGDRVVGLVGMVFREENNLSEDVKEHIHGLCQPLALALELTRLAKVAQRNAEHAAVLTERTRIAREIHDGLAQSLLAIQMQLDRSPRGAEIEKHWFQAQSLVRQALQEARRAVAALRPRELMDRPLPRGLAELVERLIEGTRLQLTFEAPPYWQGLGADIDDHLFRMVQESVNNVIRHADAVRLRIELSQDQYESTILIGDDGRGFNAAEQQRSRSFGMEGMRQRAHLIGAVVQWISRPGEGTDVLISLPHPASSTP